MKYKHFASLTEILQVNWHKWLLILMKNEINAFLCVSPLLFSKSYNHGWWNQEGGGAKAP